MKILLLFILQISQAETFSDIIEKRCVEGYEKIQLINEANTAKKLCHCHRKNIVALTADDPKALQYLSLIYQKKNPADAGYGELLDFDIKYLKNCECNPNYNFENKGSRECDPDQEFKIYQRSLKQAKYKKKKKPRKPSSKKKWKKKK